MNRKFHIIGALAAMALAASRASPRQVLQTAELVLGSESTLALVPELTAQRLPIGANLPEVVHTLETHIGKKRLVVVASGDPLFYGVARYLCDKLGSEHCFEGHGRASARCSSPSPASRCRGRKRT